MEFFQPDKYQRSQPVFCSASEADRKMVSILLSEYYDIPLDRGADVHQAGGAEINSNNFRVETTGQRILVKRFSCRKQRLLLEQKLHLCQWLQTYGIPIPGVRDNSSQRLLTSHGGYYWCVMEFVEGTYFNGTNTEIERAARTMEQLFRGLDEAPAEFVPNGDPVKFPSPPKAQELIAQVEAHRDEWSSLLGPEAEKVLSRECRTIKHTFNRFPIEELWTAEGVSLSHIDLHPHNLLFSGNRVAAVLDFESFRMAPRLVMVSFGAYKLLRQAAAHAWSHGCRVDLQALVAKYLSGLSDVEFLPANAGALAMAEITRRLFNILQGVIIVDDQDAQQWLGDIPMHVNALQEVQRLFPESAGSASSQPAAGVS
jgi:Ser/Thr protein kinase RdoA (MazF antagonist)